MQLCKLDNKKKHLHPFVKLHRAFCFLPLALKIKIRNKMEQYSVKMKNFSNPHESHEDVFRNIGDSQSFSSQQEDDIYCSGKMSFYSCLISCDLAATFHQARIVFSHAHFNCSLQVNFSHRLPFLTLEKLFTNVSSFSRCDKKFCVLGQVCAAVFSYTSLSGGWWSGIHVCAHFFTFR